MKLHRCKTIVVVSIALIVTALIVIEWLHRVLQSQAPTPHAMATSERKVLYWYDPMVPAQHFDTPGKSPFMDMALVPKYADEKYIDKKSSDDNSAGGIRIDTAAIQNLGVRLAAVETVLSNADLTVIGTVQFNERELTVLQARTNGFVQRAYAHAVGDRVKRGELLAEVLVPEWLGVQHELLVLQKSGDTHLIDAARARAAALGMPQALIEQVLRSGKPRNTIAIGAPRSGVIKTLDIRAGMTLAAGDTLAAINGNDTLWLEMSVPETQAYRVAIGQPITAHFNAMPQAVTPAKIIAILPELDQPTRSVRIRAQLDNRDGRLRVGDYAQVSIASNAAIETLTVPSAAVIRGGESDRTIVANGDGTFMPVVIRSGREFGERTEILQGLSAGQQVVVSGQFLIDSEANLQGALDRLTASVQPAHRDRQAPATGTEPQEQKRIQEHGAHPHD